MTLAGTQALLHAAITGRGPAPAARLAACLRDAPGLDAAEGLALHAAMYRGRLHDALRETFPRVARALGPPGFARLADAYLARHPSTHHDVGRFGRSLAAFLRRRAPAGRPWLADLAALEWARQQVFFAPEAAAATADDLAALDPGRLAGARLRLAPALRVLALGHDVTAAWRSLAAGEDAAAPAAGPCAVAVWRRGFEVFHAALGPAEAEALARARAGAGLARLCASFAGAADPTGDAHRALSGWLGEGWIARVAPPPRAARRAGGRGSARRPGRRLSP